MGQVDVKLGKCEDAITSYEKFLGTNPPAEPSAAAKEAIETCKTQMAAAQPPPQPEPPPQHEGKAFYTDVIGTTLVGVGVASAVGSVVLYSMAVSKLDDADAATTYAQHKDLVDDAHTKRNIAVVLGGVGAVALGVGIWHYTKFKKEQQAVAVTPTTSGGMVTWMGRF
jgi:hypothetical protein